MDIDIDLRKWCIEKFIYFEDANEDVEKVIENAQRLYEYLTTGE